MPMQVGGGGVYIYHAVVIASNHASSGNAINLDCSLFFISISTLFKWLHVLHYQHSIKIWRNHGERRVSAYRLADSFMGNRR